MIIPNTRTLNLDGLTAPVQFRKRGDPSFVTGPPLWNGRCKLIMLEPETDYEILANGAPPQIATTRSESIPKADGRDLEATPATLFSLLPTLLPGDTLRLRGGTYFLPVGKAIDRSGAPDNYITIEGYPGERAILTADLNLSPVWVRHSGPIWKTPMTVPKVDNVWEGDTLLWRYYSLSDLGSGPGGYFHDRAADVLYLRAWDDGDPNGREWHITQQVGGGIGQGHCLEVTGSYVEIKGLFFKWVAAPLRLRGHWCVVDSCEAFATHYLVVTGGGSSGNIVRNSKADGGPGYEAYRRRLYNVDWAHGRGIWARGNAVSFEAYGNRFSHLVEGISCYTYRQEDDPVVNPNVDLHHNECSAIYDDAFEVDGAGCNFGLWANKTSFCFDSLSLAPLKVGPAYIFLNQFTDAFRLGDEATTVKTGADSRGLCYLFHNSIYNPKHPSTLGANGISAWATGAVPDFLIWNNIFFVSKYITTAGSPRHREDYNILWTTAETRFWKNSLTATDIEDLRSRLGFELHGLQVDPDFRSPPDDLTPSQGINLGTPGPLLGQDVSYFERALGYAGAAPDMGAIEVGGPPPAPVARFSASPVVGYVPLDVALRDESLGPIDAWRWDFGDGSAFDGQAPPPHRYSTPRVYTITLTVTGPGGSHSASLTVEARQVDAPIAAFTADLPTGVAPLTVAFTNRTTGEVAGYLWESGDGQTLMTVNATFTYRTPGSYTARLTATGPGGLSSAEMTITVLAVPLPPVAAFTPTPREGPAPLTVQFTDESVGAETWSWDFGDGSPPDTHQNPSHVYSIAGDYAVILSVNGPGGSDTESATIMVTEPVAPPVPVGTILAVAGVLVTLALVLRRR